MASAQWAPESGWTGQTRHLDGPTTLVLAFGASSLLDDPVVFEELHAAHPRSVVVGCSSAGHALGSSIESDGLVVSATRFATSRVSVATVDLDEFPDPCDAGAELSRRVLADHPDVSFVLVFADGLDIDAAALVAGLDGALPSVVEVSGALAGDGDRFERTWVLVGGTAAPRRALAVGLSGPRLSARCSDHGGWDAFGPDREITGSDGCRLNTLDGAPALTLYRNYLGALAVGLPATALLFPLAVRGRDEADGDCLVRMVLATDDASRSLRFAAAVPEGGFARMMRADFEHLIGAAQIAAETVTAEVDTPTLALAVSCAGRRLVLGDRTGDELDAALDGLPDQAHLVAVYGYGQLAPRSGHPCRLHNQTIAITTIQELP